jgi:HK97 family phage prohead protease
MPWHIERLNDEYCVIKDDNGDMAGRHPTRAEAEDQLATLSDNDGKRQRSHRETQKEFKNVPFYLIKADELLGQVESIVSVMGIIDLGDDVIHNGSYTKTITERRGKIRVLDNHNTDSTLRAVGYPIEMREVGKSGLPLKVQQDFPEATGGLYCKTQFLIDTPEGLGVFKRIAAGAINEWSIGYDALDTDLSKMIDPKTGKERYIRNIRTIRLWEYSPVLWGMNQATAVVGAKNNMPDNPKAASDAPDYRAAAVGQTERCASCQFYKTINETSGHCEKFDFVAQPDSVCASYQTGEALDKRKEYTVEGPQRRFGDYLVAEVYGEYMEICNKALGDGLLSDTEHQMMCDNGMTMMKSVRNGMSDDVALRPYSGGMMDMFMLWGARGADESKAGRVLSAKNATKIATAMDSLLEVLIDAGIYTPVEIETQDEGKTLPQAGSTVTLPTDYLAQVNALETDVLTLEIGGLEPHA